jgi:hypothetical protein
MKTLKIWHFLLSVVCILFIAMVIYGFNTDCPNTAGYVFCGNTNGGSLQR